MTPGWSAAPGRVAGVRAASALLARVLDRLAVEAAPGVSPRVLADRAHDMIVRAGGRPALLLQRNDRGEAFPAAISVARSPAYANTPPDDVPLGGGDLVTIDCAVELNGWHADAARPLSLAEGPAAGLSGPSARAAAAARTALEAGLAALTPGSTWRKIGRVMKDVSLNQGVRLLPGPGGHGIGRDLHEPPLLRLPPAVMPCGDADAPIAAGQTLALEPVVVLAGPPTLRTVEAADGWTLSLAGCSAATRVASAEATVLVTDRGAEVLAR